MIRNNQQGQIDVFLERIGFTRDINPNANAYHSDRLKILVIGHSKCRVKDLIGVAKSLGITRDQIDYVTIYSDIEKHDFHALLGSCKYRIILAGPMAHNQKGVGDYDNMILRLEVDDNYPPTKRVVNSRGSLEITKTSFKMALQHVLEELFS